MRLWSAVRSGVGLTAIVAVALAPGSDAQPLTEPSPCESFSAVSGDPADVEQIKGVVNQLVDAYRGSSRSPTRVLRLFDPTRFLSGFTELERNLERDFEVLRNRELICRRGTLSIRGELAVLQSQWEKIASIGPGLDRFEQKADVSIQFTKAEGRGGTREWKITGLLGNFFGSTRPGDFADLAVAAFSPPGVLPLGIPVTLTATVENRGAQPTASPVLVRFFDATDARAVQIGGDTAVPPALPPGRSVAVSTAGPLPRGGIRRLLVVVDPLGQVRELTKENNRLTASVTVAADAILTIIPDPNPVSFSKDTVTIRLVDPDQAGKRTARVRVTHKYESSSLALAAEPEAFLEDEEELDLTETSVPGTFELVRLTTGHFGCPGGPAPQLPTKRNDKLQYPRGPECFNPANVGSHRGLMTVIYVDPVDARGRRNITVRKTGRTTWPNVQVPFVP